MNLVQVFSLSLAALLAGPVHAQPGARNVTGSLNEQLAKVGMPPSASGDGGLDGIYAGTEQRQAFNSFTRLLEYQWIDWIYFFSPDGIYMRAVPNPAKNPPDWVNEFAKLKAYEYGRYSFRGTQLTLRPGNGTVGRPEYAKLEGDRLNLGGYYLWRVPPARDGAILLGKWHSGGSVMLGNGAGPTGMAASSAVWEFKRSGDTANEGTYTVRTGGGSSFGASSAGEGTGKWQFKSSKFGGGWLELRDRNMSVGAALSVLSWPNAPDVLYIENRKFTRAK